MPKLGDGDSNMYSIKLGDAPETVERLLPLMQMGMTLMRGEKLVKVLAKVICGGPGGSVSERNSTSFHARPSWIRAARAIIARMDRPQNNVGVDGRAKKSRLRSLPRDLRSHLLQIASQDPAAAKDRVEEGMSTSTPGATITASFSRPFLWNDELTFFHSLICRSNLGHNMPVFDDSSMLWTTEQSSISNGSSYQNGSSSRGRQSNGNNWGNYASTVAVENRTKVLALPACDKRKESKEENKKDKGEDKGEENGDGAIPGPLVRIVFEGDSSEGRAEPQENPEIRRVDSDGSFSLSPEPDNGRAEEVLYSSAREIPEDLEIADLPTTINGMDMSSYSRAMLTPMWDDAVEEFQIEKLPSSRKGGRAELDLRDAFKNRRKASPQALENDVP